MAGAEGLKQAKDFNASRCLTWLILSVSPQSKEREVSNLSDALDGHILFSARNKVSRAIADPGLYCERYRKEGEWVETLDHWQARAAIEAMLQLACSSPSFAQAIAARQRLADAPSPHS